MHDGSTGLHQMIFVFLALFRTSNSFLTDFIKFKVT